MITINPFEPYYRLDESSYAKGPLDAVFVLQWVAILLVLREYTIRWLLRPLGKQLVSMNTSQKERHKNIARFTEQSWSCLYYMFFWSWGMSLVLKSPFSPLYDDWTQHFWLDYPHTKMNKINKIYYLAQAAFWVQQLFVLNIEKRRKDHWQMFTHHCITVSLVVSSYVTNYTRVGQAILVTMDQSDIFLDVSKAQSYTHSLTFIQGAKVLKYMGWEKLCDATFLAFMFSWVFTRQIVFGRIIWSVWVEAPLHIQHLWEPSVGHYYSYALHRLFLGLLLGLQFILFFWLILIIKVAIKFVRSNNVEDIRSDDEEDSEDSNTALQNKTPSPSFADPMSTSSSTSSSQYNQEVRKR
ncbi:hypothetical protein E3P89_00240 [Wallemia ichthyophaga]|uniref:TLC domain-containing protein n=1 Tax=Wallemia ichthyophaga TaxID=245174 RepID=A0A4T0HSQ4_WALIC|nr:hypothetical protein E3P90_00399 [Wallemia ichthyophaga]TIB18257.1 hypothetical protein E3P93_00256 [Wallemia ichthyophaga]TIB22337.1 hypothetical protein E3P88_03036 [Wallemia ichthyophaga]TIB25930.1 hypothetical protein E3P89_00240 [Wallemia ichthyophaga]